MPNQIADHLNLITTLHTRLKYLLDRHLQNSMSEQEQSEFQGLVSQSENESELFRLLEERWKENDFAVRDISQTRSNEILQNILQAVETETTEPARTIRLVPWWRKISVAIILILLCVTGAYLYFSPVNNDAGDEAAVNKNVSDDILPGTHSATLELSDGRSFKIDDRTTGVVANEGSVGLKINGSVLTYSGITQPSAAKVQRYNIVRTGNGQEYEVKLTDGTQIWLNPVSSIRYPVPFDGDLRSVVITGEVEFEVTKDPKAPFSVSVIGNTNRKNLMVNVLGTHFKINAYPTEPKVKTTLAEGSVELVSGSKILTMKPGQQGSLDSSGEFHLVNLKNVDKLVNLKSGLFFFQKDDIKSVLREIARWYDVELVYDGPIGENKFSGSIQKSLTLNAVMKKLSNEVKYEIDNKKLIIKQ